MQKMFMNEHIFFLQPDAARAMVPAWRISRQRTESRNVKEQHLEAVLEAEGAGEH